MTSAWWTSGTNPAPGALYSGDFVENLAFNNGQDVVVTAQGQFNMYRPIIQAWQPLLLGTPQLVITNGTLSLGIDGSGITIGNSIYYVGMNFQSLIYSDFSGSAAYTQLITGTCVSTFGDTDIPDYELDNYEWYNNVPPKTIHRGSAWSQNNIEVADSPGVGVNRIFTNATAMDLSFKTYLRFEPNAGPGPNIYVTLQLVTWGVSATATYVAPSGWVINPGSSYTGPSGIGSAEFPIWTNVFSNSGGISL